LPLAHRETPTRLAFQRLALIAFSRAGNEPGERVGYAPTDFSPIPEKPMNRSPRHSLLSVALVALGVAALLAGCKYEYPCEGTTNGCQPPPCGSDCAGTYCVSDAECGQGFVCLNSICAPVQDSGCTTNAGCAHDSACVSGSCKPLCRSNGDCDADQYCVRGSCRDIPDNALVCQSSADCLQGGTCINGYCTLVCAKDADCPTGEVCEDYYCKMVELPAAPDGGVSDPTDAGQPDTCLRNTDCAPGSYCINAQCHLGCAADSDCPSTERCQAGICQPRPTEECTTGADCPEGNDCVDASCRARCVETAECPTGAICKLGYCMPGSGAACTSHCDCPITERCVDGICQP
jgi:hypothetical protein